MLYIYIYIHIIIHIHIHIYIYIYICIHYIYIYIHVYICLFVCLFICLFTIIRSVCTDGRRRPRRADGVRRSTSVHYNSNCEGLVRPSQFEFRITFHYTIMYYPLFYPVILYYIILYHTSCCSGAGHEFRGFRSELGNRK